MKNFLLCILLCLTTVSYGTARPEVKKAFKANVQIHQETQTDSATCTATAIGPQALLTATHCELPTDDLDVSVLDKPVKIVTRIRDGHDHTIYLYEGEALKDTVAVEQNKIDLTDPVFIWGNPGELTDMYRTGVLSGSHQDRSLFGNGPLFLIFDLNAFHGDSGAGIFREDGVLVDVVSFTFIQGKGDNLHRMTGVYPMMFKAEDLAKAKTFSTPQVAPKPKQ